MINFLKYETVMTIPEFLELQRGESLNFKANSDKFINIALENKRFKKFIVTLLGCSLYFEKALASEKGIDPLGWKLMGIVRHWAYWILLIMCIVEIVKAGLSGESNKTFSILMKFLVIFASMYLIPELFDAIKEAF